MIGYESLYRIIVRRIDWKITGLLRRVKNRLDNIRIPEFIVSFKIWIACKVITYKLILRGKKRIELTLSNRSESKYITYHHDGLYNNYIKIRVSGHGPTKNDNSDLFITFSHYLI